MKAACRLLSLFFLSLMLVYSGLSACKNNPDAVTYDLNLVISGAGNGSVTSDTGSINCNSTGGTCSANYDENTVVTLTATPESGYIFKGWSGGNCSGVGTCQVTLSSATTVRAVFTMILFSSNMNLNGSPTDTPAAYNIWVMKTDGSGLQHITASTASGVAANYPDWSPDGEQVIFTSDFNLTNPTTGTSNTTYNIWTVNNDGSNLTPLTSSTVTNAHAGRPFWSPNGEQIVFVAPYNLSNPISGTINNSYNVWVMNSDGSGLTHLTNTDVTNSDANNPRWSPDGEQILFQATFNLSDPVSGAPNSDSNIWVMNSNGSSLTALTTTNVTGAEAYGPEWSPDGNQIIFSSNFNLTDPVLGSPNAATNVWMMDTAGSHLAPVTESTASADAYELAWSPDGEQIIFVSNYNLTTPNSGSANSNANVWVVNSDGTDLSAITTTNVASADAYTPFWLPNQNQILFRGYFNLTDPVNGADNATTNIWIMDADGSNLNSLTESSVAGSYDPTY